MIATTLFLLLLAGPATAVPSPSPPPSPAPAARYTVLVLPLESTGGVTEPWVSEAVADQLPRSLRQLGVPAVSRAERLQAQAALEIPDVPLTRATSVRVAEALGATRLVMGTYAIDAGRLTLSLRLLDVERATLSAPLIANAPIEGVMDLIDRLAWDVALAGPTPPAQTREVLAALRPKVTFEVFKAYARGLAARDPKARATLLRSALTAAPTFDAARLALGRLLLEQREFSAAGQTLARVPASSPLAREAYFTRGVALLEIGRYREASRVYSGLAQTEPTPGALNNYALAVLRDPVPNSPKASDILRQALALDPESVDLGFNLAWALLAEDDATGAAFQLQGLTKVVPLDKHTRVVLVWALRRAGREQEADRQWQGVVALAPVYSSLIVPDLSRRFERIQRSERPFELARESRSDSEVAAALYMKAQRLFDGGDAAGALAEATRAGYLDPYNRSIHLLLARLHRAHGDGEKALNEFRMALWSEDDATVRVEVAGLLREMGRPAEARAEAARALALAPGNEAARKLAEPPQ
ncbi:MAG TPA: tetratricopeptide repeat protein [Vicinamibacteria bacterium]|nr:tetratricopeptide repeat protein [Vicinamibacteria bacterium]